jgi:hypothetical protein
MNNINQQCAVKTDYCFDVDMHSLALSQYPPKLVTLVLNEICKFVPSAMENRSYDAQAILGPLWDNSHISHVQLGQILSSVAQDVNSPLEPSPDSRPERKRYRINI